jgi:hypothetical protein
VLDPFEYNLVSTPSPDSATSRSQGGVEWGLLCDCLFGGVERNKGFEWGTQDRLQRPLRGVGFRGRLDEIVMGC